MRLRKPCQHGRYEKHSWEESWGPDGMKRCPGGEFLADDTLIIEKVDGEWLLPPKAWEFLNLASIYGLTRGSKSFFNELADTLTVREGAE